MRGSWCWVAGLCVNRRRPANPRSRPAGGQRPKAGRMAAWNCARSRGDAAAIVPRPRYMPASPSPSPTTSRAVFLSYAREDTAAANRIAEALRSHGVEVWFDQSELRGGDAWDAKTRRQIKECALFVPIVSEH